MSSNGPHDLFSWTAFLSSRPLPALPTTLATLREMSQRKDSLSPSEIARTVLTDPLFTLLVLRRLQERKASSRRVEITTIEHALMMLGVEPFFAAFAQIPALGDMVSDPAALEGVARVAKRSYVASQLARDWADRRMDTQGEEIQVAALIHDMAELLLWIHAPEKAKIIADLLAADPALRSAQAQASVLGFPLSDAETELCRLWGLPELSRSLLKEQGQASERALIVRQAARLARHCQNGFDNAALPDDWIDCAELLDFETPEEAQDALTPRLQACAAQWDARVESFEEQSEAEALALALEDGSPPSSDQP